SAKAPRWSPQAALRSQVPEARLASSRGLSKNEALQNFLLKSSRLRGCGARQTFLRSRETRDTHQIDEAKEELRDSASISPRKCLKLRGGEAGQLRPREIVRRRR